MKKKLSLSLIMFTLCISIFVGGCSCNNKPTNPNANVILATEITLDKNVVRNAMVGQPISITYTINPSNTTDKTMVIESSDETIATIDKEEVSGKLSETITVTPVGVGTVNIVFTWKGTFDNDYESEDRTLRKSTTIYVVGEFGKETLNTPTNLTYSAGKFSWDKVSYGTDGQTREPNYELVLTGGASPTTPVTLSENEYAFALTAGVTYTAKVKAKPTDELQNLYTASAYSDEIEVYKLTAPTSFTTNDGVVTWDKVEKANKYVVNVNGVDVETISATLSENTISFDAKEYFAGANEITIKVKAINDEDPLIFDGEYSVNTSTIYQIGQTSNFTLTLDEETYLTTLTWDEVEHATNYTLEILKQDEVQPTVIENLTTNSYTLSSTLNGTYNVRVKALGGNDTLSGEFTEYFQFKTLNVDDLVASVENGKVTYSHSNLNGNTILFTIYANSEPIKVTKTANGSFNVSDYTLNGSYIITARIIPQTNSNYVVSASKTIGQNYALSLTNSALDKSQLVWDKISNAESFTLEIKTGDDVKTYSDILATSDKVVFEIPSELTAGSYEARVKAITNENLSQEFGNYFEFTKLDINNLNASLSEGTVTYSATSLNGNKIVFYIINDGETIKVEKTEDGSFNVSDYTTKGSYIITAKLVGDTSLGYANSELKTIGQNYDLSLKNSNNNKTLICWDNLSNAESFTLEIKTGEDVATFDNILSEATKVEYELPSNLLAGAHSARLKVVTNDNSTSEFGEYFDFTKLDAQDIETTYIGNVFTASTTNENIDKIIVFVEGGSTNNQYTLNSDDEIDFTTLGLTAGNYTISVMAVSNANTTFANSDKKLTEHDVVVVDNPEITSISKDGKLMWTTNENYSSFTVYVDKGTENEQVLPASLNELTLSTLQVGEHTAYVVANPINNILVNTTSSEFTFTKLGLVENVKLGNNTITWDSVTGAGGYEIVDNDAPKVSVDTTTYTPTTIKSTNTYKIKAIGNGTNTVSGAEFEVVFNKVATVEVGVLNGKIDFEEENDVTYKVFVNNEEIAAGKNYNFTGSTPYEIQEVYVLAFREGYFDSDKSNVLKIKKLGKATNILVSSVDKENYTITWDAVTGANSYIVNYNNKNYIAETNSISVVGELLGGTYQVKITATYSGSKLFPESDYQFGYVIGDESEVYTFNKLSVPENIAVKNGVLTWENKSVAQVTNYEIEYSNNSGDSWTTKSLNDELSNDLSFLTAGTYLVKIRAVGNNSNIISSDFSAEVTVIKSNVVSGLKVKNGVITWNPVTSDNSAYVYDVYVYTKSGESEVLYGEPSLNYAQTTYEIPNIAENTEYYVKVIVKNAEGVEIYSDMSSALKVIKLNAPTNFAIELGVASWDAVKYNSEIATNDYRISLKTGEETPLYYDITSGILQYTIPSDISVKTSYYVSVMAHGTNDSGESLTGYLNSDYSNEREIYKLASVANLRVEDGEILWETTHTSEDKYLPESFKLIFTKYVTDASGGVETHEYEFTLATNVTHYSLSDAEAGDYKLEFYVMGNGIITQNSLPTILGDTEKIKKLSTPTGLRMQDGYLVWNETDLNTNVLYVLYNNGVEFTNKNYDDRKFAPNVIATTGYNITIKSTMEGAIYSELSDNITIYQLPQVTNFVLDDGKFKWNAVENATGYTIIVSYKVQATNPDTSEPMFDPETNEPIMEDKEETIVVAGGSTTEISIPATLPQQYTVKEVYANGNTTSDNTSIGYFNSIPINSSVNFTPLDTVKNLTVKNGDFVWDKVTGADYYSIQVLNSEGTTVIKKASSTTNSYTLNDDGLVPAGSYKLQVTPISLSDTYLTTGVATEIPFSKMGQLTNIRIENGYVAWNVLKDDILAAYATGVENPDDGTGTGGEDGEDTGKDDISKLEESGGGEAGGEAGGEELTFTSEVFNAFYSVAVGPYIDNADTAKFYPLAYIKLKLTSLDNSKVVTKTVQPFTVVDPGEDQNYVICYYFVDVDVNTWKISISAKGNTVNPQDTTSIKYVDGVQPTTFMTATKLDSPLCPVHYDTTMIVDGRLVFTPVKLADGTLYDKYIIEAVPANLPAEQVVLKVITVEGDASQTYNVQDIGLKEDIAYNISIKTYGTENGNSGDLYLNSNTPSTTSLTLLGKISFTVSNGVITWNASTANYFIFKIRNEDGTINETHELDSTVVSYELDNNYPAGKYYITIQAIGDGVNKISSVVSDELVVIKNDIVPSIVLNNGEFVWSNTNADNGYKVMIIKERGSETGEQVVETEEIDLTQIEKDDESVTFSLPDTCVSYYVGTDYNTYYYRYSIKVMKLGTANGVGGSTQNVNSEYSAASYAYQRLNTPSNVRVNDGQIVWNDVGGASGYQVYISGNTDNGGSTEPFEQEVNVGSDLYYNLPNSFAPGVYHIKVRALGGTPQISTPTNGYLTSVYSDLITVVRVAEPNLRVDRGEVVWNSVEGLPFEATSSVKLTINGEETILTDLEGNAGFDFDNPLYPADEYTISVQFIGNNELITGTVGDSQEEITFYYLSSNIATRTFTKLNTPTILLGKTEIDGEDRNIIRWQGVENALGYDVYVVTETIEYVGEDDPETPEDDREEVVVEHVEVLKYEDYAENFGTFEELGVNYNYFTLQDITYEDYKIYIRAVGDGSYNQEEDTYDYGTYISSTRSDSIHIHIPLAPTNFAYNNVTGTITWTNVTADSKIVLDVKKFDGSSYVETVPGGIELPAGTTSYKLNDVGDYQVRIKSRLSIIGGDYDSDYSETTLNISFNLFSSGSGTEYSPYVITKEEELNNIRYFLDRTFTINGNIILNSYSNWEMIGNANNPFTGTIKGNGFTISNIRYTTEQNTNIAFIYEIAEGATVQNLKLDVTINSDLYNTRTQYYGGVAITNKGTISNCEVTGSIKVNGNATNTTQFGGIVNDNYGTITNTINKSNVIVQRNTNTSTYVTKVGGIAARNFGTIINSGNEGELKGQDVGGIACYNYKSISYSYNTGKLNIVSDGYTTTNLKLGGIAAYNDTYTLTGDRGTIDTCYVIMLDGQITSSTSTGSASYIGGIVGNNNNSSENCISNCYALIGEYNVASGDKVAALVGNVAGMSVNNYYRVLKNCYAYRTKTTLFVAGSGNEITNVNVGNRDYVGRITDVTSIDSGVVSIPGIIITEDNNYMPQFSWQA